MSASDPAAATERDELLDLVRAIADGVESVTNLGDESIIGTRVPKGTLRRLMQAASR